MKLRLFLLLKTYQRATLSNWIDIEDQRPEENQRVIVLIPFGMRVEDDTWTGEGWLNGSSYVSHWQPINPPGTYSEIMSRPQGEKPLPVPKETKVADNHWFSDAVIEHQKMMSSLTMTQFKLRLEATKKERQENG